MAPLATPRSLETNRNVGVRSAVRRGPTTRGFVGCGAAGAASAQAVATSKAATNALITFLLYPKPTGAGLTRPDPLADERSATCPGQRNMVP